MHVKKFSILKIVCFSDKVYQSLHYENSFIALNWIMRCIRLTTVILLINHNIQILSLSLMLTHKHTATVFGFLSRVKGCPLLREYPGPHIPTTVSNSESCPAVTPHAFLSLQCACTYCMWNVEWKTGNGVLMIS